MYGTRAPDRCHEARSARRRDSVAQELLTASGRRATSRTPLLPLSASPSVTSICDGFAPLAGPREAALRSLARSSPKPRSRHCVDGHGKGHGGSRADSTKPFRSGTRPPALAREYKDRVLRFKIDLSLLRRAMSSDDEPSSRAIRRRLRRLAPWIPREVEELTQYREFVRSESKGALILLRLCNVTCFPTATEQGGSTSCTRGLAVHLPLRIVALWR